MGKPLMTTMIDGRWVTTARMQALVTLKRMTQLAHPEIGNHRSFSWTSAAVSAAPVARDGYGGGGEGNDDMPSRVS
jgi:hypothetical protein